MSDLTGLDKASALVELVADDMVLCTLEHDLLLKPPKGYLLLRPNAMSMVKSAIELFGIENIEIRITHGEPSVNISLANSDEWPESM